MVFRRAISGLVGLCVVGVGPIAGAQNAPSGGQSSVTQRITTVSASESGAWTSEQVSTMARIRDTALSDSYTYSELAYLTDSIGPRLAGSTQASAAVQWVANEMRSLGAEVTLEKTSVPRWVRGEETAALTTWPGMTPDTSQRIVITALGGSVATPGNGLVAPVIAVNSFSELEHLGPDAVKGKIVLFNRPFDKELTAQGQGLNAYIQNAPYRVAGASAASALGAAAVLVRSLGSADFRLPHTGLVLYKEGSAKIPAAAVTAEDADLLARLTQRGQVVMRLVLTPKALPAVTSYNVVADWKGADHPEQVVIVSGHLDSWDLGTGAIDDGAGVVTGMEAIHVLHSLGIHPHRTIRFIAWMNEEGGGTGAATYASDHAADVGNHVAAMESDSGADHPTGLVISGAAGLAKYLAPIAQVLDPIGASVITSTEELPSVDVAPLVEAGVPGFAPAQDLRHYFDYHHTAADTLDKVNKHHLDENAAVIAVTAYAIADAATPPPRK